MKEFVVKKARKPFVTLLTVFGILSSSLVILGYWYGMEWLVIVGCMFLLILFWRLKSSVTKESILVMSEIGVQIEQVNPLGWNNFIQFLPRDNIKAIVINETVRRQRVITYLALLLHSPDSYGRIIVPLFRETLPRLAVLEKMYIEIWQLLKNSTS